MNTENLKTFLTLAEVKNFRKAAQHLFIVQSTVSSRIQDLESELGQKLFERSNKSLCLTPAGQRLIPYAQNMLNLERTILSNVGFHDCSQQTLNIGVCDSIYDCYIHPHIPNFLKKNPEISLNIINNSSPLILNALQDDEIDIGISFLPNYDKSYETILFSEEDIVLVTSSQNTIYSKGVTLSELLSLPLYSSDYFMITKDLTQWYNETFPSNYHFTLKMDIIWKLCSLLSSGNGYGFVPKSFVKKNLENHSMITIPLNFPAPPSLKIYVTAKKNHLHLYKVQQFLHELHHHMRS